MEGVGGAAGEINDKQSTFVVFVMRTSMNPTVVLLLPAAGAASKGSVHGVHGSIYSESPKTHVRNVAVRKHWKTTLRWPFGERCQIASAYSRITRE
jgi:hypothetical protein